MSQDPTSQAPPDVKQEAENTINVKVRVSLGSKGGWDRDVTLNVGATNLGRLVLGRGGILQDQTHNKAFQAPGCVCEQSWKGRWQHQVRGVSLNLLFSIFFFFTPALLYLFSGQLTFALYAKIIGFCTMGPESTMMIRRRRWIWRIMVMSFLLPSILRASF